MQWDSNMNVKDKHVTYYKNNGSQDNSNPHISRNYGQLFYKHLDLFNPKSVCDVGCGNGKFLKDMVTKYGCTQAYGVDIATVELGMVITDPRITYFSSDSTKIPLEDKSVDLVTAFDSLEHVSEDNVDKTLTEFTRVSRNGFMFSIAHWHSGEMLDESNPLESNLHSCAMPKEWWIDKISSVTNARLVNVVDTYSVNDSDNPKKTETIWKF